MGKRFQQFLLEVSMPEFDRYHELTDSTFRTLMRNTSKKTNEQACLLGLSMSNANLKNILTFFNEIKKENRIENTTRLDALIDILNQTIHFIDNFINTKKYNQSDYNNIDNIRSEIHIYNFEFINNYYYLNNYIFYLLHAIRDYEIDLHYCIQNIKMAELNCSTFAHNNNLTLQYSSNAIEAAVKTYLIDNNTINVKYNSDVKIFKKEGICDKDYLNEDDIFYIINLIQDELDIEILTKLENEVFSLNLNKLNAYLGPFTGNMQEIVNYIYMNKHLNIYLKKTYCEKLNII